MGTRGGTSSISPPCFLSMLYRLTPPLSALAFLPGMLCSIRQPLNKAVPGRVLVLQKGMSFVVLTVVCCLALGGVAAVNISAVQAQEGFGRPTNHQWEYKYVPVQIEFDQKRGAVPQSQNLNEYGKQGWEAVGETGNSTRYILMKRQL